MYKLLHCKSQPKLYNAILKYGWDNFKVDILWSTTDDANITYILNQLEEDFVNLYDSVNIGYNCMSGGGSKGRPSKETKKKMSETAIGRVMSDETKHILSINAKPISSETRHKMNKSCKKDILQYTKGHIFIKEWNGVIEASNELNIDSSSISKCLKNKRKTAGGFIWKYI